MHVCTSEAFRSGLGDHQVCLVMFLIENCWVARRGEARRCEMRNHGLVICQYREKSWVGIFFCRWGCVGFPQRERGISDSRAWVEVLNMLVTFRASQPCVCWNAVKVFAEVRLGARSQNCMPEVPTPLANMQVPGWHAREGVFSRRFKQWITGLTKARLTAGMRSCSLAVYILFMSTTTSTKTC